MSLRTIWLVWLYMCFISTSCWCAKILLSSEAGSGSHFSVLSIIGKGLVDKDHHVTALISQSYEDKTTDDRYAHLEFDVFPDSTTRYTKDWSKWVMKHLLERRRSLIGDFGTLSPRAIVGLLQRCSELLDHALERHNKGVRYDLLVIDAHKGCSVLLAAVLDTPYVLVVPSGIKPSLARRYGTPDTTAFFPEMTSGLPYQMTFLQRFSNTLSAISEDLSMFFTYDVYSFLFSFKFALNNRIAYVMSHAQLIFVNCDFVVDFPFPVLPNVIPVGGLTTKKAQPLTQEWSTMMSSNRHGVVLFTLGTYVDSAMTLQDKVKIADAFAKIPQTVIWQTKEKIPTSVRLSGNIKISPWVPQNDLLGHPNMRALVFHGGNNGMYEAVFHGVPMVVIPMVLDTLDVAARVIERGLGVNVDYFTMTSDELAHAINTVIINTTYKLKTQRASAIFRDRPHLPLNRTVYWIEHVLKYGGDYLRPSSPDLYWWQLHLFDVYACMLVIAYIAYRLVKVIAHEANTRWRRHRKARKENGGGRLAFPLLPPRFRGMIRKHRLLLTAVFAFVLFNCVLFRCIS